MDTPSGAQTIERIVEGKSCNGYGSVIQTGPCACSPALPMVVMSRVLRAAADGPEPLRRTVLLSLQVEQLLLDLHHGRGWSRWMS